MHPSTVLSEETLKIVITIEKRTVEAALACLESEGFEQDEAYGVALDLDDPDIVRVRGLIPSARLTEVERTVGVLKWEDVVTPEEAAAKAEAVKDVVDRLFRGELPEGVTLVTAGPDGKFGITPVPDEIVDSPDAFRDFVDKAHKKPDA